MSRDAILTDLIEHTYRERARHRAAALDAGEPDGVKMGGAYPANVPPHDRNLIHRHLRDLYGQLRSRFKGA